MAFLRANFKVGVTAFVLADSRGVALSEATGLPSGYIAVSQCSQLLIWRGDAFVVFNPAASTL